MFIFPSYPNNETAEIIPNPPHKRQGPIVSHNQLHGCWGPSQNKDRFPSYGDSHVKDKADARPLSQEDIRKTPYHMISRNFEAEKFMFIIL